MPRGGHDVAMLKQLDACSGGRGAKANHNFAAPANNDFAGPSLCSSMKPLLENHTAQVVSIDGLRDGRRYFTALRCPSNGVERVCLVFKNRQNEEWVGALSSNDGLNFTGAAPSIVLRRDSEMTHNLAVLRLKGNGGFAIIGGSLDSAGREVRLGKRLSLVSEESWQPRVVMDGLHEGCENRTRDAIAPKVKNVPDYFNGDIREFSFEDPGGKGFIGRRLLDDPFSMAAHEKAPAAASTSASSAAAAAAPAAAPAATAFGPTRCPCAWDGRMSLVHHHGRYLLYARDNIARGVRGVQVSESSDGLSWSAFQSLQIGNVLSNESNLYFWAAQKNPASGGLIALAPVVHRGGACIGFSASSDGVRWSKIIPLIPCRRDHWRERSVHQPAAGIINAVDGSENLWLYVHEHVGGIKPERVGGDWGEADSQPVVTRLVRYTIAPYTLGKWTAEAWDWRYEVLDENVDYGYPMAFPRWRIPGFNSESSNERPQIKWEGGRSPFGTSYGNPKGVVAW